MDGWAKTCVSSAVIALAIGLAAVPAGALALPVAPVTTPAVPRPPVAVPHVALPTPSVPKPALPKPALPKPALPKPALPKPALPPLTLPGSIALPGPGVVPSLLAPIPATVGAVARAVPPPADVPPSAAPVRAARGLLAPLQRGSSTAASRIAQSADPPSSTSDSMVRSRINGNEVRVVPASVCSSQVAFAVPAAPEVCTIVTPEVAAELGLPASPDGSPFAGIPGLALTGASILGLVLIGALALGLGGATRPFRGSRARRRSVPA